MITLFFFLVVSVSDLELAAAMVTGAWSCVTGEGVIPLDIV